MAHQKSIHKRSLKTTTLARIHLDRMPFSSNLSSRPKTQTNNSYFLYTACTMRTLSSHLLKTVWCVFRNGAICLGQWSGRDCDVEPSASSYRVTSSPKWVTWHHQFGWSDPLRAITWQFGETVIHGAPGKSGIGTESKTRIGSMWDRQTDNKLYRHRIIWSDLVRWVLLPYWLVECMTLFWYRCQWCLNSIERYVMSLTTLLNTLAQHCHLSSVCRLSKICNFVVLYIYNRSLRVRCHDLFLVHRWHVMVRLSCWRYHGHVVIWTLGHFITRIP